MFYISGVKTDGRLLVTDTSDGIEECLTEKEVVNILENTKIHIYGTSLWDHRANPTILNIGKRIDDSILIKKLEKWSNMHNQWNGYPVWDYLAEVRLGSVIRFSYYHFPRSARSGYYIKLILTKKSWDEWHCICKTRDDDSSEWTWGAIYDGDTGGSNFAASCLEGHLGIKNYKLSVE